MEEESGHLFLGRAVLALAAFVEDTFDLAKYAIPRRREMSHRNSSRLGGSAAYLEFLFRSPPSNLDGVD